MKSIRIHSHGSVDVLSIDDILEPTPSSGEVKIRIKATSLNHMDLWVREGIPGVGALPLILGCDGCGVVDAVGSDVADIKLGERVFIFPLVGCGICKSCKLGKINLCRKFQIFGEHRNGVHAEYVCVPSENVMKLADHLSFAEGAAFPLTFLTAWHMLVTLGEIKPDQFVLVMGAASGVGCAAVQIAKMHGAKVIATAGSTEKLAEAKNLGADFGINHYSESLSKRVKEITAGAGVDLIFEHVGEKVWQECLKALAWGGRLITCGATSGPMVSLDLRHIFIKQQQIMGSTMGTRADMIEVNKSLEKKLIKPIISKEFHYTEIKAAHLFLQSSKNIGKVILTW